MQMTYTDLAGSSTNSNSIIFTKVFLYPTINPPYPWPWAGSWSYLEVHIPLCNFNLNILLWPPYFQYGIYMYTTWKYSIFPKVVHSTSSSPHFWTSQPARFLLASLSSLSSLCSTFCSISYSLPIFFNFLVFLDITLIQNQTIDEPKKLCSLLPNPDWWMLLENIIKPCKLMLFKIKSPYSATM